MAPLHSNAPSEHNAHSLSWLCSIKPSACRGRAPFFEATTLEVGSNGNQKGKPPILAVPKLWLKRKRETTYSESSTKSLRIPRARQCQCNWWCWRGKKKEKKRTNRSPTTTEAQPTRWEVPSKNAQRSSRASTSKLQHRAGLKMGVPLLNCLRFWRSRPSSQAQNSSSNSQFQLPQN